MLHPRSRRVLIAVLAPVALLAGLAPPAQASSPTLTVPSADLEAAVSCSTSGDESQDAVLVVHGTATTSDEHFGWNYTRSLTAQGFRVCTVDFPDRMLGDIQTSAEYLVHAIRVAAQISGTGSVDLIGHSQGALVPRWAIRWWDDVAAVVDDAILLAPPSRGTVVTEAACLGGSCAAAAWQMRTDAEFITAVNGDDEAPGDVDYTVIYSATDELVQPFTTAPLTDGDTADGSTVANHLVQELCPGRPAHHIGLNTDPAVAAVVFDALDRPGPGRAEAVTPEMCLQPVGHGLTLAEAVTGNLVVYGNGGRAYGDADRVAAEPALRPYATPMG